MVTYTYKAEDETGRVVAGQIEAPDAKEARRLLEQQGLRVLEVTAAEAPGAAAPAGIRLSAKEAGQLAQRVGELTQGRFPLASGLRAAADECENPRQARALVWLAEQLEQGRSLEEVLTSSGDFLPRHLSGLIMAAVRTGQLGTALAEFAEHQHTAAALRRTIREALAYPLLVLGLALAVFMFILVFATGGWRQIFEGFGVELPLTTQVLLWWHDVGLWVVAGLLAGLAIVALLVHRRLGPAGWHRFLASVPAVGPLWHSLGLAEWSSLLVVLVRHQIPLPEALRLAAEGVSNAHVGGLSRSLAEGVSRGRSLSQVIASLPSFPASLVPLVRWGEKGGDLAEALTTGREMLEQRVRMRSFWLRLILPPVLFLAIGCGVLLVIGALFLPMFSLLQALSS